MLIIIFTNKIAILGTIVLFSNAPKSQTYCLTTPSGDFK